jgi:hypothetical protein
MDTRVQEKIYVDVIAAERHHHGDLPNSMSIRPQVKTSVPNENAPSKFLF